MINLDLHLETIEVNKMIFAEQIINLFHTYQDIDNLHFSVDEQIFSNSLSDNTGLITTYKTFFKEKINITKIGFLSLKNLKNLAPHQLSSIQASNKINVNHNNNSIKQLGCLFHFIFIGNTKLINSHIDSYPFEYDNGLSFLRLDNFSNSISDCPALQCYLLKNNLEYLSNSIFHNDVLDEISTITEEQNLRYPLNLLENLLPENKNKYLTKKIIFYRNSLEEDLLNFYGLDMNNKIRAISLFKDIQKKFNHSDLFDKDEHHRKKI